GDAAVKQEKYTEGITNFKAALVIRPGDQPTTERIANAEKLLAQMGEKAKKDAEFNRLIAEGDAAVKQEKYTEGITNFKAALVIRPGDQPTTERIANAEKLLAQMGEKAKKDAEFNRLIAEGDAAVKQEKYTEGITNFKAALVIRPGDQPTTERIANAENLLAQMGEKLKYQDAIKRGASYFAIQQYTQAISAYSEAQRIRPYEPLPPQKIREIQAILEGLAAKATVPKPVIEEGQKLNAVEKVYFEKTKLADVNYSQAQWVIARFYYTEALKAKPGDKYLLDRIESCEKMIDSEITAEKIKDFNNKIASADAQMKAKDFSSARFYYRKALEVMKWDAYPMEQLKLIDKLITDQLSQSDQKSFMGFIKKADNAFLQKEYPGARFYYEKAKAISETDHISARLKEIEAILKGIELKN
ncbi:MAG: hypothetical protein WCJ95_09670, partial [Mariniphaga sp.]